MSDSESEGYVGLSDRTKRRKKAEMREKVASAIGCCPDDLHIEWSENGEILYLEFDNRPTVASSDVLDEWVFKRRRISLSQSQLEEVKPQGVSRRQVSRRTEELSFKISVRPFSDPLTG